MQTCSDDDQAAPVLQQQPICGELLNFGAVMTIWMSAVAGSGSGGSVDTDSDEEGSEGGLLHQDSDEDGSVYLYEVTIWRHAVSCVYVRCK